MRSCTGIRAALAFWMTSVTQSRVFSEDCFELGEQRGSYPMNFVDTEVQADLYLLQSSESLLESDSKVRSFRVCYEDKAVDPSLFRIQAEVWSRTSGQSMWLSSIGDASIDDSECEQISPTGDYVVTRFDFVYHTLHGITQV